VSDVARRARRKNLSGSRLRSDRETRVIKLLIWQAYFDERPNCRLVDVLEWARCQELAIQFDPWAHFSAFGTARVDCDYDKPGKLNSHLGLATEKGGAA
jgi:hypothetical protein